VKEKTFNSRKQKAPQGAKLLISQGKSGGAPQSRTTRLFLDRVIKRAMRIPTPHPATELFV
jgi:hypothetical protein